MSKIHLIGNSHLDPVWLWRWQEGFSEILSTYRSALDRMNEFPDYKFTSACAVYYQWIEKMDPEMFEEIKARVKEGRWSIVGGWFLQPDCNIPCGESFARHGLISQRYFKEKFGVIAKTGYNVDSFGHNAGLPQILKKSGMDNYVFMRPFPNEQGRDEDIFLWESADGTRIPTYRIPLFYNIDLNKLDKLNEIKQRSENKNQDMMAFFGVGNHGGGPTIELMSEIEKLKTADMIYSTTDEYFASLNKSELPVVVDELQHHARGCYSAETFVKMQNRKCENNLLAAEKFCSMAENLTGAKYPAKKLKKGWKNLMFNHFHDIIAGCCIKKAYEDAGYLYGEIMSITEQEINAALMSIAQNIDTLRGNDLPSYKLGTIEHWHIWETETLGMPVVVFNPHAWRVKMPVQVTFVAKKVTDEKDNEVPFQIVRGDQTNGKVDKLQTIFTADIEPMGYAVYRVFVEKEAENEQKSVTLAEGLVLENDKIKVEFSPETGDIYSILNKKTNRKILDGNCRAILLDETADDTWAHGKTYLGEFSGAFGEPEFSVIENGAVRSVLRVVTKYNNSTLRRDYILEAGNDIVKVNATVDFYEKHRTLKLTFPTRNKETIAKIPFGTIKRKNNLGEEPCGSWISNGDIFIANNGKYGYDTLENEVRLTILRSSIYADHFALRDEFCEYMEQGVHEFSYWISAYSSNKNAEQNAQELNFKLPVVLTGFHKGKLPERGHCFEGNTDHIVVTAVKKAEDGNGTVIRFYETDGVETYVSVELFGKKIETAVAHNEIKTFNTNGDELNLIEW